MPANEGHREGEPRFLAHVNRKSEEGSVSRATEGMADSEQSEVEILSPEKKEKEVSSAVLWWP